MSCRPDGLYWVGVIVIAILRRGLKVMYEWRSATGGGMADDQ